MNSNRFTHKLRRLGSAGLCLALCLLAKPAGATILYWDPEGTGTESTTSLTGTWSSTSANWSTSSSGGGTLVSFNTADGAQFCAQPGTAPSGTFTVTVSGTVTCAGIFNGAGAPSGYNVILSGGTIALASGAQGIESIGSDGDPTTINSVLAGPGFPESEGSAGLILNGANTFSGFYIGGGGGVSFGNNNAFGSSSGAIVWLVQGFIQPAVAGTAYNIPNPMQCYTNGTETFAGNSGGVTFSGAWTLPPAGDYTTLDNIADIITVAGPIGGGGGLTITNWTTTGAGWLLTGTNTFTGPITNKSATLTIGGSGSLGSGTYAGAISLTGALIYASSAAQTLSGAISGTGSLVQDGSGMLTLSGLDFYSGATTIGSGSVLEIGGSGDLGNSGGIGSYAGLITNNGTFTYASSASQTNSGVMSGTGTLVQNGPGTLTLSANNTYSGGTTISGGTINIGTFNTPFGGSAGTISLNGGNIQATLNRGTTGTENIQNPLSISGNSQLQAAPTTGTRFLTFGGPVSSTAGTLTITNTATTLNSQIFSVVFTNTATLNVPVVLTSGVAGNVAQLAIWNFSSVGDQTYNGIISGSGSIYRSTGLTAGTGARVIFTAANTYSGGTSNNDGEIACGISSTGPGDAPTSGPLGTGAMIVGNASGKISAYGGAQVVGNHVIVSSSPFTFVGTNNLTMSGNFDFGSAVRTLAVTNPALTELSGSILNGGLTVSGGGTLTLANTNGYTGVTTISNNSTLLLTASGAISNSSAISIYAGSTFDVSAAGITLTGASPVQTLAGASASGIAAINAPSQTATLNSGALLSFHAAGGASSTVGKISLMGASANLTLNNNAVTVNVTGSALAAGSYRLMDCTGVLTGSANPTPTVTGTALSTGYTATVSTTSGSAGHVDLIVQATPSFSGLTATPPSITYGTTSVTLSGKVSSTGGSTTVYPANGDTVSATINGITVNGTVNDPTGDFSITYNDPSLATDGLSGSPYTITYAYAGNSSQYLNAAATDTSTTLMVNQAPLTITANNQNKTYGQTVVTTGSTQFTSSPLQNGETIASVSLTISGNGATANAPVSGSPYTITPSAPVGTLNPANYALTFDTGTLTVSPATLTVTATGTLVYGQDPSNAVYVPAYATLAGTDTVAVITGSADFSTDATATNYVGTNYTAHVVDTGTLAASNYTFAAGLDGILTITPAPLTVTNVVADDMTYDGTNIATLDFSGAGLDGFVNGDGASVSLVSSNAVGLFPNKNVGIGLTVTISGVTNSGGLGTNYTVIQPTATATIFQLSITVSAVPDARTYDGTTNSVGMPTNYPALAPGDTAAYTQAFASRNAGTGLTLIPAVTSLNDGNGGANYSVSLVDNSSGIIAPLPITVTAVATSKPYDGTVASAGVPTVAPGLISPDTGIFTETYDTPNAGTGKTLIPAAAISDGNGGSNYDVTLSDNTNGVVVADSLTITANAQSKTYGTALSLGTTAFTVGAGLVNPEAVTAVILSANGGTAATDPVSGSPYTITPSGATGTGGFLAANYSITYVTNLLTVNPLTVILTGTRDYDGTTNVPFGDLSVSNAVGTDDVNVASGSAGLAGANAGTNAITSLGTLALGGTTSNNYTLAGASGAVVVSPLPVVLTGGRPYDGTATADYTVLSIANVVGLDDVSLASGSVNLAGPNAGPEAISSPGTLALGGMTAPNYTVTGVSGTVTIAPVALSITASAQSKTYGTALSLGTSAFTVGAGLVSPETVTAVTLTASGGTNATDPVSGSPYTITPSAATGSDGFLAGNYDILYNTGALTVNPLAVILSGTRPYDGTATAVAGILSVANAVGTDDVNVATGSAPLTSGSVGSEAITSFGGLTLGGLTAPNYTLMSASGTVLITNPYLPFSITLDYIDGTGTNFVLVWQSVPGVVYQVMGSTNLSTWAAVGGTVTATAATATNVVPVSSFPFNSFFDVFGE